MPRARSHRGFPAALGRRLHPNRVCLGRAEASPNAPAHHQHGSKPPQRVPRGFFAANEGGASEGQSRERRRRQPPKVSGSLAAPRVSPRPKIPLALARGLHPNCATRALSPGFPRALSNGFPLALARGLHPNCAYPPLARAARDHRQTEARGSSPKGCDQAVKYTTSPTLRHLPLARAARDRSPPKKRFPLRPRCLRQNISHNENRSAVSRDRTIPARTATEAGSGPVCAKCWFSPTI